MSLAMQAGGGAAVAGGIAIRALSSVFGAEELFDCRPIGVGEIIEGAGAAGIAGLALLVGRRLRRGGRLAGLSIAGICGALPVSSSVIAILKVPSTITTTLAPTSSERILEVMFEAPCPCRCLGLVAALVLGAAFAERARLLGRRRGGGGLRGAARGGNEARRTDRLLRPGREFR